ncbi:Lrp/AsnC family transcriptional regulator [Bradyrhizobium ivorense]|uniref:Lrp/AsnC family transcriptional regulator n=1 Tax=Bradyrhizobium ivorense TaxID=2511166 RepID=UPI0010BC4ACA|nr:Lrp/AsnC family transcriptional regulator [Bradyrhizobium ivorense]VIO67560.1 DNA-binding transcriptional activator DecR [Bradyrhizobium ivorense]
MTAHINGITSLAWTRQAHCLDRTAATELDRIDARLLDLVQRNNRLSSEELGAKVGLSASGVQRRLKRLRSEGVIEADISIISPKVIGRNVTALLLISFERDRADIVDRFKRAICKMPEVMSGFYVTGQADFVLLVTASDMEDYELLTRRLVHDNPDIKRFETMVVLDRAKAGFTVPMDTIACW